MCLKLWTIKISKERVEIDIIWNSLEGEVWEDKNVLTFTDTQEK